MLCRGGWQSSLFLLHSFWFVIYVFLAKVQTRNLYFCWVCDGASCNTQKKSIRTQKPFNQGSVSGVKSKQRLAEKSLVICAELKTQCLRNHTGCTFQMVNQVILQQLGKWQRTRGFMKKKCVLHYTWLCFWWNCLSLLCYAMCSASHSVLHTRPTANLCLRVFVGWMIQPKNWARERHTLKMKKKTEQDRKRDKERQRRAVTSDAVCPHLISACFQPSWCSPPTELYIRH